MVDMLQSAGEQQRLPGWRGGRLGLDGSPSSARGAAALLHLAFCGVLHYCVAFLITLVFAIPLANLLIKLSQQFATTLVHWGNGGHSQSEIA